MLDNLATSAFALSTKVLINLSSSVVARDLASESRFFVLPVRYCVSPHFLECLVRCYRRLADYDALVVTIEIPHEPHFYAVYNAPMPTYVEG